MKLLGGLLLCRVLRRGTPPSSQKTGCAQHNRNPHHTEIMPVGIPIIIIRTSKLLQPCGAPDTHLRGGKVSLTLPRPPRAEGEALSCSIKYLCHLPYAPEGPVVAAPG